ncbi:MAG: hypothetical protein COB46_13620 [Rhodospirillaceae bacterium]|nr:dynamin family protein [Colwellia sp.]PCI37337.1 MAG: hypothetical protein COB46_13620 [Rhodospirillaceae bacterium]
MRTTEIKIYYNPYRVKTEISINGVPHPNLMEVVRNRRLSQWIDSFLPKVFEELNSRAINLVFEGTTLDEEDVKYAVEQFLQETSDVSITAEYITSDRSVDERVSDIKKLFEDAQTGPIDEFRSPEIHAAFERALAPEFEVNVLATMSAGKSTLINAMLGLELMPSKNEACTATIAKIHDYDDMIGFEGKRYGNDDRLIDDWTVIYDPNSDVTNKRPTLLEKWNEDEKTSRIEVRGNIPEINEREQVRLVLVDTPGPNNSRDESHREATIRTITSNRPSMVLYVLNAHNLGVQDDKSLLKVIKDMMEKGGREAHDRFVFVVNKIDGFDPERGELVTTALNNVRSYLEENGIHNPLVIPVSAELTMMLRTETNCGEDALTRSQRGRLNNSKELFLMEPKMNMLEHVKHDIGAIAYATLNEQLEQGDENRRAEILSGVPILEQLLENYISKHAQPARLKDVVDTFDEAARKVKITKQMKSLIEKKGKELHKINQVIAKFQNDRGRIEKAKQFRERVENLNFEKNEESQNFTINIQFNHFLRSLQKRQKEDLNEHEAREFIVSKTKQANEMMISINAQFHDSLEKDLRVRFAALHEEYKKHVADVLKKSLPDDLSGEIVEFQTSLLEMKPVNQMLSHYQYKARKIVGHEKVSQIVLYNPFTWFKDDLNIPVYADVQKFNDSAFQKGLATDLQRIFDATRVKFENSVRENQENAKEALLDEMIGIDQRVDDILYKLKNVEKDKNNKEIELNKAKNIISWHDNFREKLNDVLNVKRNVK